ncbi:MAG TPA: hypothetical protein VHZ98_05490 [Galbitalea sp.]|jgi:hypothetical protein|nr:hypothetical protein [Galbitalea sp.]
MANARAIEHWENLVIEFTDEPGVRLTEDGLAGGLSARGSLFAFRDGDDVVVHLSAERAADLVRRGMGTHYKHAGEGPRDWVSVSDLSLWSELVREAHEYVGEPPIGGDS